MSSIAHSTTASAGKAIGAASAHWAVRIWLFAIAGLIFAMVIVGGATRLTDSGLSITEWQPILGAIPPLSEADWQDAFKKYQQIPEYKILNDGMSLSEFKAIYWWVWAHRFLGRFLGAVCENNKKREFVTPIGIIFDEKRNSLKVVEMRANKITILKILN